MAVKRDKDGNIVEVPTQAVSPQSDVNSRTFKVGRMPAPGQTNDAEDDNATRKFGQSAPPRSDDQKTRLYRGQSDSVDDIAFDPIAGWLVVTDGPGCGQRFEIGFGQNSIGRGPDNRIQMDIGDTKISTLHQCFVTFDPDDRTFYVASGTGINMTKLNGKPLSAANSELSDRDEITFGDTRLMFVALCNSEFIW